MLATTAWIAHSSFIDSFKKLDLHSSPLTTNSEEKKMLTSLKDITDWFNLIPMQILNVEKRLCFPYREDLNIS